MKAIKAGVFATEVNLTISSTVTDYNLFTAAGSPAGVVAVTVTLVYGQSITRTSGLAAFRTGTGWAAGSTLRLINNGTIIGSGGIGGAGGAGAAGAGTSGSAGGDALRNDSTTIPFTVDNTNGYIFGGGGGGAGGAGMSSNFGGGGGGGRGYAVGAGGAKGGTTGGGTQATDGANGSFSNFGAHGTGSVYLGYTGSDGADGGDVGRSGGNVAAWFGAAERAGGAAGKAINLNAAYITWQGGNNSSQVKGDRV